MFEVSVTTRVESGVPSGVPSGAVSLAVGRGAFENIGEAYLFLMRHAACQHCGLPPNKTMEPTR